MKVAHFAFLMVGVGALGREYFRCILCLSRDRRVLGDIVAVCSVYCVMPFPILLFFVKRQCVHSVDEVPTGMLPFYAQAGGWRGN